MIQKPSYTFAYMLLSQDMKAYYQSVDVLAQGKTANGKTFVAGIKNIPFQVRREKTDIWREYLVTYRQIQQSLPKNNPEGENMFYTLDWVSFDLELTDPPSDETLRSFIQNAADEHVTIFKLPIQEVDIVLPYDNSFFQDSLNIVAPRPPKN